MIFQVIAMMFLKLLCVCPCSNVLKLILTMLMLILFLNLTTSELSFVQNIHASISLTIPVVETRS